MGSFVSRNPVRVTVPERPDEYIEIKPKLGVGDRAAMSNALVHVNQIEGGNPSIGVNAGAYLTSLLELSIIGWRLLDDDGQEAPFDKASIAQLDQDDPLVDKVLGEIAARNPTLGKAKAALPG